MAAKKGCSENQQPLLERIQARSARVGVVGLGYVGLPFALEAAQAGFQVTGIERNPARVAMVNRGENYIDDIREEDLQAAVQAGQLRAQVSFDGVEDLDVVVIAVPTPLTRHLTPDLQYIVGVTEALSAHIRPGQLISLESTTYPGTTEEVMKPILEKSGLKAEEDFFLAHSPERVDPGNKRWKTKNTTKVVGGVGPRSLEVAQAFYGQIIEKVVPVSSAKAAELVKVFENTFRAVNIALVNEMALLCDRMGLDVWEVLDAAFTKPFGIMPFYPGPGVGGHCIPLDPHYLEWKAREYNFFTHFITLAGEINRKMPEFVREKAYRLLNQMGKAPSQSKVLLLGLAYKNDISDWRESPALEVAHLLQADGVEVHYHDPYIPDAQQAGLNLYSEPLNAALLEAMDLVIITTAHQTVDYAFVVKHARRVLDTRNATHGLESDKVVLL
ncbi:MAG TPA: nucleotide sugar dehydrogenase [Chloroflexi bacterium]|nr:nucleotide sugar dehydrogenase [Chloroflexota bacterium]